MESAKNKIKDRLTEIISLQEKYLLACKENDFDGANKAKELIIAYKAQIDVVLDFFLDDLTPYQAEIGALIQIIRKNNVC